METQNLQAFIVVCEQGSVSAAAEQLHLTQPAVSKRIKALESQLDCTLFDRIGRGLVLTPQGSALFPKAKAILNQLEDAEQTIHNLSGAVSGRLSLATSHHIGLHHLPAVLKSYSNQFPQVRLDIDFIDSDQAIDALLSGLIEVAIVTLPSTSPDLVSIHPLWADPLIVAAQKGHPLTQVNNPSLLDLSEYPAILPATATVTGRIILEKFEEQSVPFKQGLSTNYLETIKMMVSIGLGWSALPKTLIDDQLEEIQIEGFTPERQLGYMIHKGRTLSNAAKAFIEQLIATR